MIVGFNHNILYRGVGFHVQTEDGGLKSPSLVTLLYHGGIIVSSQKTSYADILEAEDLSKVVEDLAKEQHKGVLRRLTKGEFDRQIIELGIKIEGSASAPAEAEDEAAEAKESAATEQDFADDSPSPVLEEGAWLSDEVVELEPIPLDIEVPEPAIEEPGEDEVIALSAADIVAAFDEDLRGGVEPAFLPPSAEDRGTSQNLSESLDDLIFSYLTGGDDKG